MDKSADSVPIGGQGSTKRKRHADQAQPAKHQPKKQQPSRGRPRQHDGAEVSLSAPHDAVVSGLGPKYSVLPVSVISSTKIYKRITRVTEHLRLHGGGGDVDGDGQAARARPVALLYARPGEVCKLITVVEQCKRILKKEGLAVYQYNQLFDSPPREKRAEVVEATVLGGAAGEGPEDEDDDDDDDDDDFEVMESRFEQAVQPPPSTRVQKSLRIFLALIPVPELRAMSGVTLQAPGGV